MAVSGPPTTVEAVREALFKTSKKDVHRGQKDSVIGGSDRLRAGQRKILDQIYRTNQARPKTPHAKRVFPPAFPKQRGDPLLTAHGTTYTLLDVVRLSFLSPSLGGRRGVRGVVGLATEMNEDISHRSTKIPVSTEV
jgi:hypothetical protein